METAASRPLRRWFALGIVIVAMQAAMPARTEISTDQSGTPTEGWDGPGLGSATIDWFLGWPTSTCNTAGGTGYASGVPQAATENEILAAMATWSSVVDVTWNKVGDANTGCLNGAADPFDCDGDPATFQTNLVWNFGDHCDSAPFDGPWNPSQSGSPNDGHVFAHAWGPRDIWPNLLPAFVGNVHLDSQEFWVTSGASSLGPGTTATTAFVDIRSEVLHELGHVLGLAHTGATDAVMNSLKWVLERRTLTAFDTSEIQSLYAAAESTSDVVVLLDTSGSMGWAADGTQGVPEAQQRLTIAKSAIVPFLELLELNATSETDFGIARFPRQPSAGLCTGEVMSAFVSADATRIAAGIDTVNALQASGGTPLLGGLESARQMFSGGNNRAIVLLSDGYHNCPGTVDESDPAVTAAIQQLNASAIKVYAIGFGRPTDVDPLLERLAADTGGSFFDVTTTGFDPVNWTPPTALQETYKDILVDALNLQVAVDPLATIAKNETLTFGLPVSGFDDQITVYVSWRKAQQNRLGVAITTSDGAPVPNAAPGIVRRSGQTYQIVRFDAAFLNAPGKTGAQPWAITIDPQGLKDNETEPVQYSVLLKSDLKLQASIRSSGFETGNRLLLIAGVRAAGQAVTGLDDVYVSVSRPDQGLGNWFAQHLVSKQDLQQITPGENGFDMAPRAKKVAYLTTLGGVAMPRRTGAGRIKLYDDGTHGDVLAADGVYSNTFDDTSNEGTYEFHFTAQGTATGGVPFIREAKLRRVVQGVVDADESLVKVESAPGVAVGAGLVGFQVTFVPRDSAGNHLGPGQKGAISIRGRSVKLHGSIVDNLDGSYTAVATVPEGEADNLILEVGLGGATVSAPVPSASPGKSFYQYLSLLLLLLLIIAIVVAVLRR